MHWSRDTQLNFAFTRAKLLPRDLHWLEKFKTTNSFSVVLWFQEWTACRWTSGLSEDVAKRKKSSGLWPSFVQQKNWWRPLRRTVDTVFCKEVLECFSKPARQKQLEIDMIAWICTRQRSSTHRPYCGPGRGCNIVQLLHSLDASPAYIFPLPKLTRSFKGHRVVDHFPVIQWAVTIFLKQVMPTDFQEVFTVRESRL